MAKRDLKMHNKLLLDVIRRQAGTADKACLEGIMNAVEAGASAVYVDVYNGGKSKEIEYDTIRIKDNGEGIKTENEIERFFETFGTPHEESENKTWAQFRMGRGQLFSFGNNVWRTSTFKMTVDIEKWGLKYDLETNLDNHEGCEIEVGLYDSMNPFRYTSLQNFESDLRKQIEFFEVPVFFNNKQLNRSPKDLKWDHEDENAYYLFNAANELSYYNLGAFVMSRNANYSGVTGVIVSKKQLKVNFARNDIQADCEVFQAIQKVVKANRRKRRVSRRRALNKHERISSLIDIRDGEQCYKEVETLGLLENSSGNVINLAKIRRLKGFWTFSEQGNRAADRLLQQEKCLCLNKNILEEVDYHGPENEFFDWLMSNQKDKFGLYMAKDFKHLSSLYVSFEEASSEMSNSFEVLNENKLNVKEKAIIRFLNKYDWEGRRVVIGMSDTASAWTDGSNYIAIDRDWLKSLHLPNSTGTARLINVMVHELAHDEDTRGTHIHGEEFYHKFHDLCVNTHNPKQSIIASVHYDLKNSKLVMRHEEKMKKERKAKEKRDAKLGIAANSK